ncbi:MAG: GNAT family N-acetyltransferase [Chloroflexi bacterium]|nr:GNAT family N-acetyltransferase [Chloroflexota bacterium]
MGTMDPTPPRFSWGPHLSEERPAVQALTGDDVRDLRLPWLSRFSKQSLAAHLQENPGLSFWVPATGEYVVAEPWRRRTEIAQIMEVTARKGRVSLLQVLLEELNANGFRIALMLDDVWHDQPKLYIELGFSHLERVIFFQKDLRARGALDLAHALPELSYNRLTLNDLDLLLELDHSSFPWLWWNGRTEMESYLQLDNVAAYIAWHEGVPVGYSSFTLYHGWAHLDRLAVIEQEQGRNFGAAQLAYVLGLMAQDGAGSVSLSTQQNNTPSQRLYTGFGFKQTRDAMNLYGINLPES